MLKLLTINEETSYELADGVEFRIGDIVWTPGTLGREPQGIETNIAEHHVEDGDLMAGDKRINAISDLFSTREAALDAYIASLTSQIALLQRFLFRARNAR